MKNFSIVCAGVAGAIFAAGSMTALADEAPQLLQDNGRDGNPSLTTVGPVTGKITALNYDADGRTVNGLFIGATNTMLTFDWPVCGGVGGLGKIDDSVTYSGSEESFSSGFNSVRVTKYTDGSVTYPHMVPAAPTAYALTAGKITALNYDPRDGAINGFFFAATTGAEVFVDIGHVTSTLEKFLAATPPVALSVTGVKLPPPLCSKTAPIDVVVASSVNIGSTAYPVGGYR